jgi:hypothetical protein
MPLRNTTSILNSPPIYNACISDVGQELADSLINILCVRDETLCDKLIEQLSVSELDALIHVFGNNPSDMTEQYLIADSP